MKQFIVETSARHVHVTQQDLETLFGKGYELTVKKMLSQPGQYASAERVDVVGPKKTLTGVSILGPVRSATQVELSLTDARSIGVTAPVRESGDIAGSGACKLVGPAGEVELTEGVIAAKRHIHMPCRVFYAPSVLCLQNVCKTFGEPFGEQKEETLHEISFDRASLDPCVAADGTARLRGGGGNIFHPDAALRRVPAATG